MTSCAGVAGGLVVDVVVGTPAAVLSYQFSV